MSAIRVEQVLISSPESTRMRLMVTVSPSGGGTDRDVTSGGQCQRGSERLIRAEQDHFRRAIAGDMHHRLPLCGEAVERELVPNRLAPNERVPFVDCPQSAIRAVPNFGTVHESALRVPFGAGGIGVTLFLVRIASHGFDLRFVRRNRLVVPFRGRRSPRFARLAVFVHQSLERFVRLAVVESGQRGQSEHAERRLALGDGGQFLNARVIPQ